MVSDEPDINKILANALIIGAGNVGKRTLESIKKLWLKGTSRYGFTPEPKEASRLKDISNNVTYQTFKKIVGKYKFTPYIKVGILLYELNRGGNKERVEEIRKDVYNSKDGYLAKKIIHLASTGVLLNVLDFLIDLKNNKELSKYAIQNEFKKVLDLWGKISVPVSNSDPQKQIIENINQVVNLKEGIVVIYGCGHAAEKAQIVIAKLIKEKFFQKNNYIPWSKNNLFYDIPHYTCFCHYLEKGFNNALSS
jgi:hypothetical protein